MKPKKNNTSHWDEQRGFIYTKKGGIVVGEDVYNQGYSMLTDLIGHTSFFQVLILNVLGQLPEKRFADWLEALFICLSYPDARIWCNQIGTLGGNLRTTPVAAISAGILASDSRLYGPGTIISAMNFIKFALREKNNGKSVEEIIENHPKRSVDNSPLIPGYARPLLKGDERVIIMQKITDHLGFKKGEHLNHAYEISSFLKDKYDKEMNLVGLCAPFFYDCNLKPCETYQLLSTWVHSGIHACYGEAFDKEAESFFPLHCADIEYTGHNYRKIPS